MNDINKMPPKCQYCPYWEVCEYPWVCPDIGDNKPDLQPTCNKLATDAISRQLAIDKFAAYIYQAFKDFYRIGLHRKTLTPEQCRRVARNVLAEVPSAQPKSYREGYQAGFKDAQPERKRGKWEFYEDRAPVWDIAGEKTWAREYKCSECGFVHSVIEDFGQYTFCPNCGADMRGETDE